MNLLFFNNMKFSQFFFKYSLKKPNQPTFLQRKYVHRTYDIIAEHFDHTRFAVWPKVRQFIDRLEDGSIVYDIGCGNGKYFNNNRLFMLGCDISPKLLDYAKKRNEKVQLAASDILNLPIRSQSCDAFLCIAVLHHLSTEYTRIHALRQLSRILISQGRGLIYVWCLQQTIRHFEEIPKQETEINHSQEQDILVQWHLQPHFASQITEKQEFQYSHQRNTIIIKRYYHLYAKGELERLLKCVPNLQIVDSYYDKENWCCEVQKI